MLGTHRPLSSSCLWFIFRILYGNHKKELLRSLWVRAPLRVAKWVEAIIRVKGSGVTWSQGRIVHPQLEILVRVPDGAEARLVAHTYGEHVPASFCGRDCPPSSPKP